MGFEFLSSNLQIPYPFKESVQIERLSAAGDVAPFCAGAQIRTVDQRDDTLKLTKVDLRSASADFATLTTAEIRMEWETAGEEVAIVGTAYAKAYAYGTWIVVDWFADETDMAAGETTSVRMVFPTSAVEDLAGTYYIQMEDLYGDVPFQPSVVKQGPNEVRRVYWKRGSTLELVADRGEELVLQAGFNMEIEQQEEETTGFQAETFTVQEGRPQTRVAINAVPGAGRGQYLLCPGSLYLLTLNGVGPNQQGDTQLKPIECYWLERALEGEPVSADGSHGIRYNATLKPNELQIKNGCGPCCSCEAYVDTYLHLQGIWDRAKVVSDQINALRGAVTSLIDTYKNRSGPSILSLAVNDSQVVTVTIAYLNDTENVVNPATDWDTDPMTFNLTFDEIEGKSLSYVANSGRVVSSSSAAMPLNPDMSTDWEPVIEVNNMEVQPHTMLYWVGQFTLGDITGETVEVTVITSGSNAEALSGSASISV